MPILWFAIFFATAALLTALVNWVGLIPWRRAAEAHWTERARLLYPVRFTAALDIFMLPILLVEIGFLWAPRDFPMFLMMTIAGCCGALVGGYPMSREIYPQLDFRCWGHQVVAGWAMPFLIMAALITACCAMPPTVDGKMLLITGGYLAFHGLLQYGLVLKYLRLVRFLKPASPRLRQIVDEALLRISARVRHTWQLGGVLANAIAFPTTRELIFSDRLLEICTDAEISAVCAHELAHLTESKAVLAGRLFGSLTFFPLIFISPAVQYCGPIGLVLPYAGMFLILHFARRLSQRMEKRADQAALAEQSDEGVYAKALEKLYQANQTPAVNVNNRQTHPHLYDRMLAAGITPDYPRPARPKRMTWPGWLIVAGFGAMLAFRLFRF